MGVFVGVLAGVFVGVSLGPFVGVFDGVLVGVLAGVFGGVLVTSHWAAAPLPGMTTVIESQVPVSHPLGSWLSLRK